jgi:HPt (histidine-containing phosphotransfer) domain-containing protein
MPDAAIDDAILDQLLETVGGDTTFLAELITSYLADSPPLLEEMERSTAAGDAASLRRAAHTLKSTSASLGAMRLSAICRDIEAAASGGALPTANVADVAAEFRAAGAALAARASRATQG